MKKYATEKNNKWKIGDVTIELIFEAAVWCPWTLIYPEERYDSTALAQFIPVYCNETGDLHTNEQPFLIKYNGKNVLVDTGDNVSGPFEDNLRAAGAEPEDIDYVLFTHLHFDHIRRNTKMVNGKLVATFPNARYLMGRKEYNYWKEIYENPDSRKKEMLADFMLEPFMLHVKAVVDMGLVDLIDDDFVLDDVIRVIPAPGHTLGQYVIAIESKGDSAWISADIFHHPIQLVQTDLSSIYDYDPKMGTKVREELLERLAGTDTLLIGSHLVGDHAGFIKKADKGYKLVR